MNSFFQKDPAGKRYAVSRRDGEVFGVAGIWENWRDPLTSTRERTFAVITVPANGTYRAHPRPHARDIANRTVSALAR
jgi:putative SOS response-associated peptidase YedK